MRDDIFSGAQIQAEVPKLKKGAQMWLIHYRHAKRIDISRPGFYPAGRSCEGEKHRYGSREGFYRTTVCLQGTLAASHPPKNLQSLLYLYVFVLSSAGNNLKNMFASNGFKCGLLKVSPYNVRTRKFPSSEV